MEEDVLKLKRKLLAAVDRNHNVRDAQTIAEVLQALENIEIDEELLRSTRLGKIVNDLRRNLKDEALARRAKQLVKRWRNYVVLRAGGTIARDTRVNGETGNVENYVDVVSTVGEKVSPEWAANGKPETRNYDSRISKENCGRLGALPNATRSSSVQEQEPAAEVFDNKMQNGSLNRFVEGKCKNLASTIKASKEMVVTMNTQDWDARKLCSVTDVDKSRYKQNLHRGQKLKIKTHTSGSAITAQVPFTPRKKVKTTQELIKTVLNNSEIPQEGGQNLRDLRLARQSGQTERIRGTSELKLHSKETYVPSSTPATENHLAPLEDCKNGRMIVGPLAECPSTAAQSTVNREGTVLGKIDVSEKTEDTCQDDTVKHLQCELAVSANELNVTDSIVRCTEADIDSDCEDAECSASFEKIEGVTGIFDEGPKKNRTDDGFREWHECLSKRSYKGEFLGILPYVVID